MTQHPYFALPTTAGGATTHICIATPVTPNWRGVVDAWVEYGAWAAEAGLLESGRLSRIWMGRAMVTRFRRVFGKAIASSREQRIAMCGLMMAMCEDDANAAFRGEPTPRSPSAGEPR